MMISNRYFRNKLSKMQHYYDDIGMCEPTYEVKKEQEQKKERVNELKKNGEPRTHYSDPKYNEEKREKKNYEAYQQACLITLLNRYCAIEMQKRKRPSKKTLALPHIVGIEEKFDVDRNIYYEGENYIDLKGFARTQCELKGVFELKKTSKKSETKSTMVERSVFGEDMIRRSSTDSFYRHQPINDDPQIHVAPRRMERIISIYIHNILIDFLETKGYFFETKLSKQPTNGLQLERITSFALLNETKDGKPVTLNKNQIEMVGEKMYNYLSSICESKTVHEKRLVFDQNDSDLAARFREVLIELNLIDSGNVEMC